jgi:hypothetical protein
MSGQNHELTLPGSRRQPYQSTGRSAGFARVDLFLTPEGDIVFNEVNTILRTDGHSRYPHNDERGGYSLPDLVDKLICLDLPMNKSSRQERHYKMKLFYSTHFSRRFRRHQAADSLLPTAVHGSNRSAGAKAQRTAARPAFARTCSLIAVVRPTRTATEIIAVAKALSDVSIRSFAVATLEEASA